MLEGLFGSKSRERTLIFIAGRKEGYARQIADYYKTGLSPIQKQLEKLEIESILVSQTVGKTRVFSFNPRYAFLNELSLLLEKAITFLPEPEKEKLLYNRKRPRRKGKPL